LGPSFPWPFSHLSDRSGKRGGGDLSLPPACCDTAIGISCTALMVFCMSLKPVKVSSFFKDVVQARYGMHIENLHAVKPRSVAVSSHEWRMHDYLHTWIHTIGSVTGY